MTGVTMVPYRDRLQEIVQILEVQSSLGLLFIDASDLSRVEHDYGTAAYQTVLRQASQIIVDFQGTEFRSTDILSTNDRGGDAFLIFLSPRRYGTVVRLADLESRARRIEQSLNRRLAGLASPFLRGRPTVAVGYAVVPANRLVMPERLVARLVEDASDCARLQRTVGRFERRSRLLEILLNEQVSTVFQPLMRLADRTVIGYEALTRGPTDTAFQSPLALFESAAEADLVFELDRLCRLRALMSVQGIGNQHKLFVNVVPSAMYDPEFRGRRLVEFLDRLGLAPGQIVFEITETYAIENYALFSEAIQDFTEVGFGFAVDDLGTGHSGLEKIANLSPRYLKFDMTLVRDIDASYVRREMIRALKGFADKIDSTIIAEGIEREEELQALLELGIEYGQGYLLGRPAPWQTFNVGVALPLTEPRPEPEPRRQSEA
jgi:EAL domain-containing protein (putative c-di-GMP-specific phosphodiesterase class I)/GGDEF domain-containing protein